MLSPFYMQTAESVSVPLVDCVQMKGTAIGDKGEDPAEIRLFSLIVSL